MNPPNSTNNSTNTGNFFSNAWNNTIVPFFDREWTYIKNGWTIGGLVVFVAGVVAGVVLVVFLGLGALGIGGMVAITIGGVGGVSIILYGRSKEEAKVLWVYLEDMKKALNNLQDAFKTKNVDETKPYLQTVNDLLTFIEPFQKRYDILDKLHETINNWINDSANINAQPNQNSFNNIMTSLESAQGKVANKDSIVASHEEFAQREWDRFIAAKPQPKPTL